MNKKTTALILTKRSLCHYLEDAIGLESDIALSIIESFFEEIIYYLEKDNILKLRGLGTFSVVSKKARPGRNLKTGESMVVSARNSVSFKISPALRKILNQLSLSVDGA